MSNPFCKCENKLHKHEIIDWNMGKKYPIINIDICGKTIITSLSGIVDKECCYTIEFNET